MDLAVIVTYRCNSRCSMCRTWRHPSRIDEEITPRVLDRLPSGLGNVSITGGEPTLRNDLAELAEVLRPKARVLEISSNGLRADRLAPILRRHPDTKIRFSLEGFGETNDRIRGEPNGYSRKLEGLLRLKEMGAADLGFGTVIQDANADELLELYRLCRSHGLEFATSALHNGFQFHRTDNEPFDRLHVVRGTRLLIAEMLKSSSVKDWFRAYLNLGLVRQILGLGRLLPCAAGERFAFIDPWANLFACNVRLDTYLGNLTEQSWEDILTGPRAREVAMKVTDCRMGCWMVATARAAMRNRLHPALPKVRVAAWVIRNLFRVRTGRVPYLGEPLDASVAPENGGAPFSCGDSIESAVAARYRGMYSPDQD